MVSEPRVHHFLDMCYLVDNFYFRARVITSLDEVDEIIETCHVIVPASEAETTGTLITFIVCVTNRKKDRKKFWNTPRSTNHASRL